MTLHERIRITNQLKQIHIILAMKQEQQNVINAPSRTGEKAFTKVYALCAGQINMVVDEPCRKRFQEYRNSRHFLLAEQEPKPGKERNPFSPFLREGKERNKINMFMKLWSRCFMTFTKLLLPISFIV